MFSLALIGVVPRDSGKAAETQPSLVPFSSTVGDLTIEQVGNCFGLDRF
jgi:hypothetical protein